MKTNTILFIILFTCLILIQCSTDKEDQCTRADWVGTYILNSEKECISDTTSQEVIVYDDSLVLTLSTDPDKIVLDGFQFELQDCFFGNIMASLTLNENTISYKIGACSAQYVKID